MYNWLVMTFGHRETHHQVILSTYARTVPLVLVLCQTLWERHRLGASATGVVNGGQVMCIVLHGTIRYLRRKMLELTELRTPSPLFEVPGVFCFCQVTRDPRSSEPCSPRTPTTFVP